MRIVCFHLYNDHSGSPRVLSQELQKLLERGHEVMLATSRGGVLDSLRHPHLHKLHLPYRFATNKLLRGLRFGAWQVMAFFTALRQGATSDTVFYINTIMPIGAALGARLRGKRVVYHYHEHAPSRGKLYGWLCGAMQRLADEIICVSESQQSHLLRQENVMVIPNRVSDSLRSSLRPDPEAAFRRKRVLMLASPRDYKGIPEFINLASEMPKLEFSLVLSCNSDKAEKYMTGFGRAIPANLKVHPLTSNPADHYNSASIVVNLSDSRRHVESFGLTALEAMACGLPVIVPAEGGIAELVEEGKQGYHIPAKKKEEIKLALRSLLSDRNLYLRMARAAQQRAITFDQLSDITLLEQALKGENRSNTKNN